MGFFKQTFIVSSCAALAFLVAPSSAGAQTLPSVTVQTFESDYVYHRDFDVLVLDFTIQTVGADALETLTVLKNGTAREGSDYVALKLWADEGPAGFQGWGIDKPLGQVTQQDGVWLASNINYTFTSSKRFFASIETGTSLGDKLAQFALQPATDNGDGIWQQGEQGVFLKSGVTAYVPTGSYSTTTRFKTGLADYMPPKGYVSLPSLATVLPGHLILKPGSPVVFQGEAKDRSGSSVTTVSLTVNGQGLVVSDTGVSFSSWSASYLPTTTFESLTLQLNVIDSSGKTWQSVPYYVTLDAREPSFEATTLAVSKNSILGDGVDSTKITIILNDDSFSTLANRSVSIKTLRSGDVVSTTQTTTDAFGKAVATMTSTQPGTAVVQVYAGDQIVGGVAVLVQEAAEPAPQPEPEPQPQPGTLQKGDLIKASLNSVYYYDGTKRHVFVNEAIYRSWYGTDFSSVKTISDQALAAVVLGAPVGFRPGTLIKTPSVPEVYVVDLNQTLRHVTSEPVAAEIFGTNWNKKIHDLSEALLFTYQFGESVITANQYDYQEMLALPLSISDEL